MASVAERKEFSQRTVIRDKSGNDNKKEPVVIGEEPFDHMKPCPVCEKRIFDLSGSPCNVIRIRLKCPHCRKIVVIPICSA